MFERICCPAVVVFVLIAAPAVHAYEVCTFQKIADYSVEAGGYEWRHVEWGWICWDDGDSGSGEDTGAPGPQPPPPPPPPSVRIVSASDENAQQVTLNFEYSGNPTSMTLRKNGQVVSSGSPASYGLYGSLDNMVFDSVLTVTMCNAGGCGEASADVRRRTSRPRAEGAITAQWVDAVPIDPYSITLVAGYENYTRILEAEIFHADYSVGTVGMRNGYAKHVQSADALLWEDGKRAPQWDTEYQIVPSWGWWHVAETAYETPGCYVATNRLPNQSPLCTALGEFAHPWYPGSGVIGMAIASGSSGGAFTPPEGQLRLDVWP